MVLLTAENIRKSYGTRVIFDDISFSIHEGDKIGVIGVNGTGKSTLLKIIAGVDQADSGTIVTMNGMRIGYLSQSPVFVDGTTVLQQVFRGENPQLALVREYEETMAALAKTPEEERLVKRAAELAEKMDKAEAWSLESEAKTILTKLGISDFGQTVETLSGGQKKRVALAAALIAPVDLLILDEWLIRPLSPQEAYDLLEIVEARCKRSMLFCTQYQPEGWYTRIDPNPESDSPVSEAIMDRIIHNSYEIMVEGRISMRERKGLKASAQKGSGED